MSKACGPAIVGRFKNLMRLGCASAIVVAALTSGCGKSDAPNVVQKAPTSEVIPVPPPSGEAPMTSPHQGMDAGKAGSLTPTPELDAKIAKLEQSGRDNKALAALYAKRGSQRMMDDQASPKIKYRAALDDDRKAVKLDPKNKEAAANKALIESIYQSMGRPIP